MDFELDTTSELNDTNWNSRGVTPEGSWDSLIASGTYNLHNFGR